MPTRSRSAGDSEKVSEGYIDWRKSLDLHVDSVWKGLFDVLQKVRDSPTKLGSEDFDDLVKTHGKPKANHDPADWTLDTIGSHMYKVFYDNTTTNARGIVEGAKNRDGI